MISVLHEVHASRAAAHSLVAVELPHLTATLLRISKSRSRSCWWDHSATLFEPSPWCAQRFQASTTHTQLRRGIAPAARGLQVGLRAADWWWPCCCSRCAAWVVCVQERKRSTDRWHN